MCSWDIRVIHLVLHAYSKNTEHYEMSHSFNVLVHRKISWTLLLLVKLVNSWRILPGKVTLKTVGFHLFVSGHQYQHFLKCRHKLERREGLLHHWNSPYREVYRYDCKLSNSFRNFMFDNWYLSIIGCLRYTSHYVKYWHNQQSLSKNKSFA